MQYSDRPRPTQESLLRVCPIVQGAYYRGNSSVETTIQNDAAAPGVPATEALLHLDRPAHRAPWMNLAGLIIASQCTNCVYQDLCDPMPTVAVVDGKPIPAVGVLIQDPK